MRAPHSRRSVRQRRIVRAFLAVWVIWGVTLAVVRGLHPDLNIGYSYADAHVLTASDWYAKHGYLGTLGIPPMQTAPRSDGTWDLYNTYPAGVFWFHELRRAVGIEALWAHRIVTTIWNHASVLLLFLLVRRFTADALIAAVAAGLYMFSGPYSTGAGGLWEHAGMLSLFATLLAWLRFERARTARARRGWLVATAALFVLDNFITLQHAAMIALIVGARAAWMAWRLRELRRPGRVSANPLLPLAAASVIVAIPPAILALRFAAQAHVMGSVENALRYYSTKAERRMGFSDETEKEIPVWSAIGIRVGTLSGPSRGTRELQGRFPVFGRVPLACGALILVAAWRLRRQPRLRPHKRALLLGGGLLLAALSWPIVSPDHVVSHPFTTLMFMPGAVVIAASIATLPHAIRHAAIARGLPARPWAAPVLWSASIAILVVPASSLRVSQVLNSAVSLDSHVRETVVEREARLVSLRAARPRVSGATEVEIDGTPVVAQALGLPFTVGSGAARSPDQRSGLLLAMDTTTGSGIRRTLAETRRRGHPRFLADPGTVVFYGHGADAPVTADANTAIGAGEGSGEERGPGEVVLRSLAFAPTLEGAAWKCSLFFGTPGRRPALEIAADSRVQVTVLSADGARIASAESELREHAIAEGETMLAWVELPREGCEHWDHLLVTFTRRGAAGALTESGPVRLDRAAHAETTPAPPPAR